MTKNSRLAALQKLTKMLPHDKKLELLRQLMTTAGQQSGAASSKTVAPADAEDQQAVLDALLLVAARPVPPQLALPVSPHSDAAVPCRASCKSSGPTGRCPLLPPLPPPPPPPSPTASRPPSSSTSLPPPPPSPASRSASASMSYSTTGMPGRRRASRAAAAPCFASPAPPPAPPSPRRRRSASCTANRRTSSAAGSDGRSPPALPPAPPLPPGAYAPGFPPGRQNRWPR